MQGLCSISGHLWREEAVIVSHICWGPELSPPPFEAAPTHPRPSAPAHLERGPRGGRSRHMARCYPTPRDFNWANIAAKQLVLWARVLTSAH